MYSTSTLALSPPVHTVSVTYNGDANFTTSTGTLPGGQTVNLGTATTTITSFPNPSFAGQFIFFQVTVAPVARLRAW
jgi:hypothetical protein